MGQILVDTDDIFGTIQRKGLKMLRVTVEQLTEVPGKPDVLYAQEVGVGEVGKRRVLAKVKAACQPPTKRKPQPEAKEAGGE